MTQLTNFLTPDFLISTALGIVVNYLTALFAKQSYSAPVKLAIVAIFSTLLAFAKTFLFGQLQINDWSATLGIIFISSQLFYIKLKGDLNIIEVTAGNRDRLESNRKGIDDDPVTNRAA